MGNIIPDHKEKINRIITSMVPNVLSIVLVGSFGRSEGGVVSVRGQLKPVNDYDLVIIVDSMSSPICLENLRKYLADELGIRQVDISVYGKKTLRKLKKTMYAYDLKYGSEILYGDDIRDLLPVWDNPKLPAKEGMRPLLLYTSALLITWSLDASDPNDRFWMRQQLSKSLLGIATGYLVLHGSYHASYRVRLQRFRELQTDGELVRQVAMATTVKLNPNVIVDLDGQGSEVWSDVTSMRLSITKIYLKNFYVLMAAFLKNDIKGVAEFETAYLNSLDVVIRKLLTSIRYKDYASSVYFNLIKIYLLEDLIAGTEITKKKIEDYSGWLGVSLRGLKSCDVRDILMKDENLKIFHEGCSNILDL